MDDNGCLHVRVAPARGRCEPRELEAEMLPMLPLEADMDWLRAELGRQDCASCILLKLCTCKDNYVADIAFVVV